MSFPSFSKNQSSPADNRAHEQAELQLKHIQELLKEHKTDNELDITENALEVSVRQDWHNVGEQSPPTEYRILLCTGGPAVQISGKLDKYMQPESAELQFQDWHSPWTRFASDDVASQTIEEVLLEFAQHFWFGE